MKNLTPKLIDDIMSCIRANPGRPPKICAARYGIGTQRFDALMKRGADPECDDPLAVRFYTDMTAASADSQLYLVDRVIAHGDADWRADIALLKVLNPAEFVEKNLVNTPAPAAIERSQTVLQIDVGALKQVLMLASQFVQPESLEQAYIDAEVVDDDDDTGNS